jgi:CRP-like cAMP-binding protein
MTIENLARYLSEHPFFVGLPQDHLATLVGCASNTAFEAGDFVFREGAPADRFYLIRHGRVALEVFVPGRGAVTVESLDAEEVLGWSWLFPPYRAHFDARALTLVRALALDGACLRTKCDKDPALGYELMRRFAPLLVQRLDATRTQLLDLYGSQP